jgi:hypothetical protein
LKKPLAQWASTTSTTRNLPWGRWQKLAGGLPFNS